MCFEALCKIRQHETWKHMHHGTDIDYAHDDSILACHWQARLELGSELVHRQHTRTKDTTNPLLGLSRVRRILCGTLQDKSHSITCLPAGQAKLHDMLDFFLRA